jgi:thiol:disulfide interchange protein DsbD
VAARLQAFRLLKADVTGNTAEHQALLEAFGLFGPPSLVFFGPDGRELEDVRIQGEIGAPALAAHLDGVLIRAGSRPAPEKPGEIAANY